MEKHRYNILNWDSSFFSFNVAQILSPCLDIEHLNNLLSTLKRKNVRLVYWASNSKDNISQNAAETLGGFLADKKTTFIVNLDKIDLIGFKPSASVEKYNKNMPSLNLESLAIQSGEYSRFAVDPKIPREKFLEMYKLWINKSLNKTIADEVLVIRENNIVIGMVTLGSKNNRGDIGLIAVDINYRGKKYGETLVHSAQEWFIDNDYKVGQVVTQGTNIPACNLYAKCCYRIEKIENYYHFWLY